MRNWFRHSCAVLCRALIGVMLLGQAINAAYACTLPQLSPAMAFAHAGDTDHCSQQRNANSCLLQYIASDQSASHAEIPVFGMPTVPVLIVPAAATATVSRPAAATLAHHATDPPPSIRFCSFQL